MSLPGGSRASRELDHRCDSPINVLRNKVKTLEKSETKTRERIEELRDRLKKKTRARDSAIEKIMRDNRLTMRRAEEQYSTA